MLLLASALCYSQVTQEWRSRYSSGPGNLSDYASSLAVDASGNVYVTGTSYKGDFGTANYNGNYTTVKYNTAGNEVWIRTYDGPQHESDAAAAVAADGAGNVYVTGSSEGEKHENGIEDSSDFATIKYDAAGNELWVSRYDISNGNSGGGRAISLALDGLGNVYVTGYSFDKETGYDYATIKYDPSGNQLWVRRHNGPGSGNDYVFSLAVDSLGNVYVTGQSFGSGTSDDFATIKYDTNGNELWVKRYDDAANGNDKGLDLAVDATGNVYVTGYIDDAELSYTSYATIKYDAAGTELWVRVGNGAYVASLAVDGSGNVYVTGGSADNVAAANYTTIKYDTQGNKRWLKSYDGPGNGYDYPSSLAVDVCGNVYVTGSSPDIEGSNDYATVKYDTNGAELWAIRYNGPGNAGDGASSLVVDGSGNVYVTGSSTGDGTGADYATIKYSQSQTSTVSSFTLINADTNADIMELKDGDTINLAALSTLNLNIRANTNPDTVGSVMFSLSGAEVRNHTENIVPYALFADNNNGDYYNWAPKNGNYILTATPYSAAKGGGTKGNALTIHFTVIGQVVSSLILVNAETDQDIKTLQNGDVIDLFFLPTDKLNIRAVVHPDTVGSVMFNFSNKVIVRENYTPYVIGGDIKGDYRAWTLPTGNLTLTATPYALRQGKGEKGKAHSVTFTVVDPSNTLQATSVNQKKKSIADGLTVMRSLRATPNPFSDQTVITFSVPTSGRTLLEVYDIKGVMVKRLYEAQAEAGKAYSIAFKSKHLAAGLYVVKLTSGKQIQACKLVLIR